MPLSDALGEVPGYQDSIRRMNKVAPQLEASQTESGDQMLDLQDVTLAFRDVTFSYDNSSQVLHNFSFTLRQGEKWRCSAEAALGNQHRLH